MKSKLDKAVEVIEHELQKMPNEQRKHIEALLEAAKLVRPLLDIMEAYVDMASVYESELMKKANDLTRERTVEEVMKDECGKQFYSRVGQEGNQK